MYRLSHTLRDRKFDLAIVPHRSIRSALIVRRAGIPLRIGFSTSAGRYLFTETVPYDRDAHEIDRNLSLLHPLGITGTETSFLPFTLQPGTRQLSTRCLQRRGARRRHRQSCGSCAGLCGTPNAGRRNSSLRWSGASVQRASRSRLSGARMTGLSVMRLPLPRHQEFLNSAGELSLLQSAELIRRCKVTISNDSAPCIFPWPCMFRLSPSSERRLHNLVLHREAPWIRLSKSPAFRAGPVPSMEASAVQLVHLTAC